MPEDPLSLLVPPVASWFREAFGVPTLAQQKAIPAIVACEHLLLSSPTGSGKTLAGFLVLLSELTRRSHASMLEDRPYVVYVSPLKALVNDVAKNLQKPLEGISAKCVDMGVADPHIRVAIRTGDTQPGERVRQLRKPPHILVTTPESLALLLVSEGWRKHLRHVLWVLVDEVHDLAPTKRGAHLSLLLERLERNAAAPPVRIGLSATAAPLAEVSRFLVGTRPLRIEEAPATGPLELDVSLPMADPIRATLAEVESATVAHVAEIVQRHRTTLVFANTRRHAETLALRLHAVLDELPPEDDDSIDPEHAEAEPRSDVATHHGSMSREDRLVVEERLKRQDVRCVVATNSLELGLDIRGVDHVVMAGSPRSVARALQRIGRSGHHVGGTPKGTLIVTDPAELIEALTLKQLVRQRAMEPLRIREAPLDVLAQHLANVALEGERDVQAELALVRRAHGYRDLDEETFLRVLGAQPWIGHDSEQGTFYARRGARLTVLTHTGTIADAGRVRVLQEGRFVGDVEEDFLQGIEAGDVFRLGGKSWVVERIDGLTLHVSTARGRHPTVPEWRGEGMSMTPTLAAAVRDNLTNTIALRSQVKTESTVTQEGFRSWLDRQEARGLPEGEEILAESFLTEDGKRAMVIHLVAGRRVNEALARALAWRMEALDWRATDLGFALISARTWRPTAAWVDKLLAEPLELDLRQALTDSEILKRRFRHVATRSLLLLKRHDVPLSQRQREANGLLHRLTVQHPDSPILEETWREALCDALDMAGAEAWRPRLQTSLRWLPPSDVPSPLGIRVLLRSDNPEGHESIRDAETFSTALAAQSDL